MGKKNLDNASSIKVNSVLSIILSVSSVVTALLTYPYLTRVLRPSGIGIISFVRSTVSYFVLVAELGMPLYGMRACSRVKDDKEALAKVVSELLSINIFTHITATGLLAAVVAIIPAFREYWTFFVAFGIVMFIDGINPYWLFRGIEKYLFVTVCTIVCRITAVVSVFLFIRGESDALLYAYVLTVSNLICSIGNFIYMRKEIPNLPRLGKPRIYYHLKPVLVFFLISCATTLYMNMDVIMLKLLKTQVEVGYYDVGLKVKTILISISSSLWTVALPRAMGHWDSGDRESAEKFVKKLLHVLYTVQFPLVLFFVVFSRPTVEILGGKDYTQAIVPMMLILLSVIAIGFNNIIGGEVLVGNGKEKIVLYSDLTGLLVNLVLNYILIMKFSTIGAALATLFTETMVALIQFMYAKIKLNLHIWNGKDFLLPSAGTVLGLFASSWLLLLPIHPLIQIVAGAVIFALVFLVFSLAVKDEIVEEIWSTVKKIIGKIFKK